MKSQTRENTTLRKGVEDKIIRLYLIAGANSLRSVSPAAVLVPLLRPRWSPWTQGRSVDSWKAGGRRAGRSGRRGPSGEEAGPAGGAGGVGGGGGGARPGELGSPTSRGFAVL